MTWNCQALRTALRDPIDTRDLASIINAITTTTVADEAGEPFFEVRLEGVARQGDEPRPPYATISVDLLPWCFRGLRKAISGPRREELIQAFQRDAGAAGED